MIESVVFLFMIVYCMLWFMGYGIDLGLRLAGPGVYVYD